MSAPADRIFTNAEVHTLTDPDETHEAVAVRDGRVVRVGSAYEIEFLAGVTTDVVDCEGQVLLPGFIDAHTHLELVGQRLVHADLADADSPAEAVSLLRESAPEEGWIQGYGYDESMWADSRYLTRADLDAVSDSRPVVAFREDMHTASLNTVALDRLRGQMADEEVHTEDGEPTGVVVEDALAPVFGATAADPAETRDLVRAAQARAHELGVTGVHDMTRGSHKPRAFRELELADELRLRIRINYWADHLDALLDTGLRTNHGSEWVRVGAVKTFTDGSIGGRTAKLTEPYSDGDGTGQWVVPPEELRDIVARADGAGFQLTVHAIGDAAIAATLDAFEGTDGERHRVEHAELLDTGLVERFVEVGAVGSVQPNFLKWAREGGLYERALGVERTRRSNAYASLLAAGVPLAFGSDCMPMDPLLGIAQTVTAPDERQRLSVTEALRAYTSGAAYAGFDEDRFGTVAVGKCADFVVLEESPWDVPGEEIADIDVAMTVVDGQVVYRD